MIPQKIVDEIFSKAKLYDVISQYVTLTKDATGYTGTCPFHQEKTPSFKITLNKGKNGHGIYKCFGCNKGGKNPVQFIMDFKNIDYPAALKEIATIYNITIDLNNSFINNDSIKDAMYLLNEFATDFYENKLLAIDSTKGIEYLKERKISQDSIRKFRLGFAPQAGKLLKNNALEAQYKLDILEKTGLVNKENDFFDKRIVFPIFTIDNKIAGFAGRAIHQSNSVKYLNSKESQTYHKKDLLYAINFAKQAIQQKDECILVEGYIDCIRLHQEGIQNVVACGGTALTLEHIQLIKGLTSNLTIIFDGDISGKKATAKVALEAHHKNLIVNILHLPDGEDPDSFILKYGIGKFEKLSASDKRRYIPPSQLNEEHFITLIIHSPNSSEISQDIEWFTCIFEDTILRQIAECIAKNKQNFKEQLKNHEDSNVKSAFDMLSRQLFYETSSKDIILFKLKFLKKAYLYQLSQMPFLNKHLFDINKNQLNSIFNIQQRYLSQVKD